MPKHPAPPFSNNRQLIAEKAAQAGMGARCISDRTGLSPSTVRNFMRGGACRPSTERIIASALYTPVINLPPDARQNR